MDHSCNESVDCPMKLSPTSFNPENLMKWFQRKVSSHKTFKIGISPSLLKFEMKKAMVKPCCKFQRTHERG